MPKDYRCITLLNALGKALESIMAQKLMTDTFYRLPDTLMWARRAKSMESAIELLTEQVHAV